MAKEEFVAVAGDDWYQRRRDDAEGRFFRQVADQGPRKGQGGSTRQGIYIFTADGKLLIYRNHQDPKVMREVLRQGLEQWKKLPAEERRPGAVKVEELKETDARYTRTPPKNGLIVNVYARCLERTADGAYRRAECKVSNQAAHDHLWLTEAEWKSLLPADLARAEPGSVRDAPPRILERIVRFHLVDNTRGEPPHWTAEQVRRSKLAITVVKADKNGVELRLEGSFLASSAMPADKSDRGFEGELWGTIVYDAARSAIVRFDLVALGEHWGEGPFTKGARPGRTPLGVAFELAPTGRPADLVPPQGARDYRGYMGQ